MRWTNRLAALVATLALFATAVTAVGAQDATPSATPQVVEGTQNSYDVIRIKNDNGDSIPYVIWVAWTPTIVTTPDGGAWVFFSAQQLGTEGVGTLGRLYASHFDPATATWAPATALPGGQIQFGSTAVVDANGTVYLVYSDRKSVDAADYSTLYFTKTNADGGWDEPTAVAPNDKAGHQLSPVLSIDANGVLHLLWQDQRAAPDDVRASNAAYADIFSSDFIDGAWSEPLQVSPRTDPNTNASRPQLAVDGDRLIAMWSVYQGVTDEALSGASGIMWSTRPAGDPAAAWSEPQTFLDPNGAQIGGRLVQLASDPTGGATVLIGRRSGDDANTTDVDEAKNELFIRRLPAGTDQWSDQIPLSTGSAGAAGAFPAIAIAGDGTFYAVYENGAGVQVDVGGQAVAPGATAPGPAIIISPAEAGAQGRPAISVDANGRVWVAYFDQPENGSAIEVRVLRGASIPTS